MDVAGDVIGADRLAERGKKHIPFSESRKLSLLAVLLTMYVVDKLCLQGVDAT